MYFGVFWKLTADGYYLLKIYFKTFLIITNTIKFIIHLGFELVSLKNPQSF